MAEEILKKVKSEIRSLQNPEKAKVLLRFFKTGKGEYGEGDKFLGITVPVLRKFAKDHKDLSFEIIQELIKSDYHEERMVALLILTYKFAKADESLHKEIFNLYLKNTKYINNWDLVDLTAHEIVGSYLLEKPKDILTKLAKSKDLWEKRISIISTYAFIRKGEYEETFRIAEILLNDSHDLIQKAVGWMLREVGKRCSMEAEEDFLRSRYKSMPRTMLRYAVERFPEEKRLKYLKGEI